MVRLPGGRVVDGKPSPGYVTLRSGKHIACPRCEGRGWVGSGTRGKPCEICFTDRPGELVNLDLDSWDEGDLEASESAPSVNGSRSSAVSQEARRKSSVMQSGKTKRCSLCGKLGHNKATCPLNPNPKVDVAPPSPPPELAEKQGGPTMSEGRKRFKGVSWNKRSAKWRAQIWNPYSSTVEQKGYYEDEIDAARAHDVALIELRGPDAVTNFPLSDYAFDFESWKKRHPELRQAATRSVTPDGLRDVETEVPKRMAVPTAFPLPRDLATAQALAVAAIHAAHAAGVRRQAVEFLVPGGSEGWPGGVRQQYSVAQGLFEGTIRDVKRLPGLQGKMTARWIDELEGTGMWKNEAMSAVVFPSAETLPTLRQLDEENQKLLLILNPQWQTAGQLVSDFGFGRSAREAEAFLSSFEDVYAMRQLRIDGDVVIVFKCYPGRWQVHYQWKDGQGDLLVARQSDRPTYADLLDILRGVPGSKVASSPTWMQRFRPFFPGLPSGGSSDSAPASGVHNQGEQLFDREPRSGDRLQSDDSTQVIGGQEVTLGGPEASEVDEDMFSSPSDKHLNSKGSR
ncbi:hypothetical protein WJX73_003397 [Symbiochloris irregularis]|uniref:AP2/ERF domain-containing protein n=1 Tax=Symbiochloris irregularis TaxID=706552 RepID=A0AAW1NRD4_9CHLO